MGKKAKEHRKKVAARNARIKNERNKQVKLYRKWVEETKVTQKQFQQMFLIKENMEAVREKNPDLFIANEDGTFSYNKEIVDINEEDVVVFKTGLPVFETYDTKISSAEYLLILKDLVDYENTAKEKFPEVVVDEPLKSMPESETLLIEEVSKEELPQ